MKTYVLLTMTLVAGLCTCRESGTSGKKTPAKERETGEATEEKAVSKADWQLRDDSVLNASITPWPPVAGATQLNVDITMNDADQKCAGTVGYRLAPEEKNSLDWKLLPKLREDEHGSVYFQAPITLPKGTTFVQLRVGGKADKDFTELTDWKVEVK